MPSIPWRRHGPHVDEHHGQAAAGEAVVDKHTGAAAHSRHSPEAADPSSRHGSASPAYPAVVVSTEEGTEVPARAHTPSDVDHASAAPTTAPTLAKLRLQVIGARNLAGKDRNGKSDPFLIINLPGAPPFSSASRDRHFYRRQTPVQPKTVDPTWKEEEATFEWNITSDWFKVLEEEGTSAVPAVVAIDHASVTDGQQDERTRADSHSLSTAGTPPTLLVPGQTAAEEIEVPSDGARQRHVASRPSNVRKLSAATGRMLIAPVRMTTKGAVATGRAVRKHGRPRPIRLRRNAARRTITTAVSAIEFVCWDKDRWSGNDYMGETSALLPNWFADGRSADWNASEPITLPLRSSRRNTKVSGEIMVKIGIVPIAKDQTANDVYARLLEAESMQSGDAALRAVPADQSVGTAGPTEAVIDDGLSSGSESEAQEELLTDEEDDDDETSDEDEATTEGTEEGLAYDSDRSENAFALQRPFHSGRPSASLTVPTEATTVAQEEEAQTEPDSAASHVGRRKRLFQHHRLRKVRSALRSESSHGAAKTSDEAASAPGSGAVSDTGDDESASSSAGLQKSGLGARRSRLGVRRGHRKAQEDAEAASLASGTQDGEATAAKPKPSRQQRRRARREIRQRRQDFAFKAAQGKDIIGIVQLEVKNAHDLPRWKNSIGTSFDMDPFVIVSFGQRIFRTRVVRHSLNPTWDEKLLFHVRRHESSFMTKLAVYDWDKLSSNDYVGEAELCVGDLIESAPKADEKGLYNADEDALHQMRTFTLPLTRHEDGSTRTLGSHAPTLTLQARFTPYAALRQRFWRQLLAQYDTNDSGTLSLLELTTLLDSLNSTLTRQTIEGFFTQFNKNANKADEELTIAEAVIALEGEIVKPYSKKRFVRPNMSGVEMVASAGSATPVSGLQTPSLNVHLADDGGAFFDLSSSGEVSGPQAPRKDERSLAEHALPVPSDAVDGPDAKGAFAQPVRTGTGLSKTSVLSTVSTSTSTSSNTKNEKNEKSVQSEQSIDLEDPEGEQQIERLTMLKNCPMCHMPRLSKKAEVDIVTHLAVCASQDWRRVDSLMVGNYVTAMQAHRKWVTRVFSKISQGQYQLGANSANIIVQDRLTGEMLEEKMQVYVRLGIRLLYKGARSRMEGARIRRMLKNMSVKQGVKFDSPASAREIAHFIAFHSLNVDEIRDPLDSFKTFNDFFYRKLKEGARPVADPDDPKTLVSSADCRFMAFASLTKATQIWIKGRDFTVERLLGSSCPKQDLSRYADGGGLIIFRLAPQDYHRFHCPADARVGEITFIEGQYYTVNPMAIRSAIDVYGENVRAIVPFHSEEFGTFYAVCIGAMMVGSIRMSIEEGDWVKRGQEMGYFAFGGSTIVIVFEENRVTFDEDLLANSSKAIETLVRVGMRIGRTSEEQESEAPGVGDLNGATETRKQEESQ